MKIRSIAPAIAPNPKQFISWFLIKEEGCNPSANAVKELRTLQSNNLRGGKHFRKTANTGANKVRDKIKT